MTRILKRIAAAGLALAFLLTPAAQAITPDQFKELLLEYYLNDIPEEAMEAETIDDIVRALGDPYTYYMDAEQYAALQRSMSDGSVVGIGISALLTGEGLLVAGVYAGSPAEALGLEAGDLIIHVEGGPEEQSAEDISALLKGEEGSELTFRVRHADGTEETYTTRRAVIIIPATSSEILDDGTTGYISSVNFGEETQGYFVAGTENHDEVTVWIVDLRNNGGGDVNAATQSVGVFAGTGTMAYLRTGGEVIYRYESEQAPTTNRPTITLVSPQTGSSAELFSQAIKDSQSGMLIGSNTFGKGIAQVILTGDIYPDILTDGDAVRITAFQTYGMNLNTFQNIGVIPDLLVNYNHAGEIALLFSSVEPADTTNWARIHLGGWRWYVDMSQATDPETAPYFAEMLSALPPGCRVFRGTGETWRETNADGIAEISGAVGYAPRRFTDTKGSDYQHAADTLYTYGILRGMGDGAFHPDSGLTRAQLCAMLVQALNLPEGINQKDFSDVPADSWYASSVKAAQAAGYVEGVGNNKFAPNDPVTHEQLITVLGRMSKELNLSFRSASRVTQKDYQNIPDTYSDWAKPWAWLLALSQQNFLGQTLSMLYAPLDEIDPKAPATRGETAQILYTIFNATSIIDY